MLITKRRQPELYLVSDLREHYSDKIKVERKKWDFILENYSDEIEQVTVLARPEGKMECSILHRLKLCWLVFMGYCDAIAWDEQNNNTENGR